MIDLSCKAGSEIIVSGFIWLVLILSICEFASRSDKGPKKDY